MKTTLTILLTGLMLAIATFSFATTITVAGTQIEIPSRYNNTLVEKRANRCMAANIVKIKTDKAAELLPLVCTEAVLTYGGNWDKHM